MSITASIKPSTQPRPVTLQWDDFSGGLNADSANYPLTLAENELADVLNYKYIQRGGKIKLRSRDGLTKVSTAGTAGAPIKGITEFTSSEGTSYSCVVADSDLKYLSSGSFVKVLDLSSPTAVFCQFDNKLIIADSGILKYWDGSDYGSTGELSDTTTTSLVNSIDDTALNDIQLHSATSVRVAQKITTSNWGTQAKGLSSIVFSLKKYGSPTGNITCRVYGDDGSTIIETSTTTLDSTTVTTSYVDYSFTFSGTNNIYPSTTYYFTLLYSGGDASNYIFAGASYMSSISGSLYSYVTSWTDYSYDLLINIVFEAAAPSATFVIQKKDRLYCNDVLNKNWLYYSNANDPNDWSTTNGGGHIIFDGHYKLNGVYSFYDEIYIFADNPKAIYKLTGDTPEEYVVKLMWRNITAENQNVIQDVGSDLIFKDTRGIISLRTMEKYGDIEKAIISKEKVNDTYVIPDWYCVGGYQVPTDSISGKVNNDNQFLLTKLYTQFILVYDQEYGCWTRYEIDLGDDVLISAYGTINGITYIGFSDGNLYYLDYSKTKDDTIDFNLRAKTPWTDLGTLMEKDARYADSIMVSGSQETYDLELYKNMDENTAAKTINTISLTKNGAFETPGCGHLNEVNFNFKQI